MKITKIYANGITYISKKIVEVDDDFNTSIDIKFIDNEPPLHIMFPTIEWDSEILDTKYIQHKFTRK